MYKYLVLPLLAATSIIAAATETDNNRWNLQDLYESQNAWDADARKLGVQLSDVTTCRGQLARSVKRFKVCADLYADINKRYARLASYANQFHDEDTGANAGLELKQRASLLGSQLEQATSFFSPEILAMGAPRIRQFIAQDKSLAIYRQPLDDILRMAPHTLTAEGEDIIATFGLATGAARSVYSIFANAELPWPTVTLADGTQAVLDQSAYTKYRAVQNRDDRKKVFDAFWSKWKEFERTIGVAFYEQLKTDTVYAKVRKYPDTLTHALNKNNVPVEVYNTLIDQANQNLPTLHRYFRLRAKMLGIDEMRYFDIYPPIVNSDLKYPIQLGNQLMLDAMKPLGDDYVAAMANGVNSRWVDVYPRPRKRSGAYMNGSAYDVHPYILLNYNDDYESVSTLAHEWGHAMHSYLSNKNQPFITARYPIFTAEIASTTNEVLLLDHMLKIAKSDDERLLYLGSALENLRGTFFRQAMFADFERSVHARVDRGESLTGAELTRLYGDILKRYHGHDEGVVKIDDLYAIEWAYIPHFYRRFYVFQYATSIAAGSMFADSILKQQAGAVPRYLNVLKAGSSAYPYELVKAAGVDLASPSPYQAIISRMNSIMDQIEAIQARRK